MLQHLKIFIISVFILIPSVILSQDASTLKFDFSGKIIDDKNNAVSYATIYIEETKSGVATNYNGEFTLKLNQGSYNIRVQHINFETIFTTVDISKSQVVTIQMSPKQITLAEVEIKSNAEDPAYAIMRRAIAKAPYYRQLFDSYQAEIYSKGTLRIDKIPKIMARAINKVDKDLNIKVDNIYTRESIGAIHYENDSINHTVLSIKSSFPDQISLSEDVFDAFTLFNIYGETVGMISPLSKNALATYRFNLENATHNEYGKMIYHIRLTPKRNNALAFTGYIDIVDSTWHVHYFDLSAKQNFSVVKAEYNIKENFCELEKDVWAPATIFLKMKVSVMKIEATIDLSSSIQYGSYKLNAFLKPSEADDTQQPEIKSENNYIISEKSKKIEEKITGIAQKEEISNRDALKIVSLIEAKEKEDKKNNPTSREQEKTLEISNRSYMTVDSLAYLRGDAYWNEKRTIPLTIAEEQGYIQKQINDSIQEAKENKFLKTTNEPKINEIRSLYYGVDLFGSSLSFNPVDGVKIKVNGYLNKRFKDTTLWRNSLTLGYSFEQQHAIFSASSRYDYFPEKRATIGMYGGQESFDFNRSTGVQPIVNTISTLFFKENYIKMYQRTYAGLHHDIELFNGFDTKISLSYEWRRQLYNEIDYSFFYRKSKTYEENIPDNPYVEDGHSEYLNGGKAALLNVELRYTPERYYTYSNRKKQFLSSKYPAISLIWKKGIPNLLGSDVDFDYLQLGVTHRIRTGLLKNFDYEVNGGWFVNRKSMHFSDFRHMAIYQFPLMFNNIYKTYHTMDAYQASTNEWIISAFFRYETLYLLLKYLPGLNKTLMTENLYLSYLKTPFVKDYIEVGYSLNNIWLIGKIGVFIGFEKFKYAQWSLKVSLDLSNL
ncbi:MAG: DUF5686 and carboxypeptidase regulatory-like domain-containing protein [Bacteroidales bacterium]|jgi:hypothetical protein|nr:DUF5686 and carboxypeptidase regulatory-like domain-containing protein [Bacteroidales bacterium]